MGSAADLPFFMNLKQKTIRFAIIGITLTTIVAPLSKCTGIDEKHLYDLLDELQRKYFPNTELNEYIIKDPKLLDNRVKRDVDKAIAEYERLTGDDGRVRMPSPRRSEKPVDISVCYTPECQALGGEIRICSPWVDNCPSGVVD
jgi:hypothetical protein